jgi:serine/threonine-protein kinase
MARSTDTLEQLWGRLGLDSLPADAGTAVDLDMTRTRNWDEATLRTDHSAPPPERGDLPHISLTPPAGDTSPENPRKDLIVTGLLGEGGMGRVLLARQESLGRDVAVKVPRANASSGTVAALVHEARTTGGLEHPGVIPVYSLATDDDGRPALVMKRVDGVSWGMLLRHPDDPSWGRLAAGGVDRLEVHVDILRQVCNAVAFAHKKGVLHRDIKPANVLIGEFGEVYVADWGVATKKPKPGEVRRASLVGSPVYLAPEMVTGDDAQMDERTDVFLLGATLYEVLTGAPPWSGIDLQAVLEKAWECRPAPPPASAPAELVAICGKAMALEPADRYQSALELREALTGFLRHRGSVQLARAASERLASLDLAAETTDRDATYAVLSECRFGFRQALSEWPENQDAQRGLVRCLEAQVLFEVKQGNLAAARVLAKELPVVSPALEAAMDTLEAKLSAIQRRTARIEKLSREMDPGVASRQRSAVFVSTMAVIAALVLLIELQPSLKSWLLQLGSWYLFVTFLPVLVTLAVAIWLGRHSILSTRLNRRLIGTIASASAITFATRLLGGAVGLPLKETLFVNFLGVIGVALTAGITLHRGFYWSTFALGLGLGVSLLLPGWEPPIFGVSAFASMAFAVLSWRGWRGEFRLPQGE